MKVVRNHSIIHCKTKSLQNCFENILDLIFRCDIATRFWINLQARINLCSYGFNKHPRNFIETLRSLRNFYGDDF